MIKRKGFKNFSRKVDGNDNLHEAEGTGGWKYTRYGLLVDLAACRISWVDFLLRIWDLSAEERQAFVIERKRLGIPNGFNGPMGSDEPMRIALE